MHSISQPIGRLAAAAIAITGIIHLVLSPEYFGEQAYLGVLFVAGALVCGYVAVKVWTARATTADWLLGAATAAGMFIGFILSRTVGLPGFKESEWELSGLISLLLEAGFLGVAMTALRRSPRAARSGRISTTGSPAQAR
jgi:hypothetical protein